MERLVIVNKADFLTRSQRKAWAAELAGRGLQFVWFSARLEQERLNEEERAARREEEEEAGARAGADREGRAAREAREAAEAEAWALHYDQSAEGGALTDEEDEEGGAGGQAAVGDGRRGGEQAPQAPEAAAEDADTRLLSRVELLRVLEALAVKADGNRSEATPQSAGDGRAQIGIVG